MPFMLFSRIVSTAAAALDVGGLVIGLDVGKRVAEVLLVVVVVAPVATVVLDVVVVVVAVLVVVEISVCVASSEHGIAGLLSFLLRESSRGVLRSSSIKSPDSSQMRKP
jgi:hypothetical protein